VLADGLIHNPSTPCELKGVTVTTSPPTNPVSNYVVSLLRTWVPVAWGSLLAWGVTQVPALEPYLNAEGMVAIGGALAGLLTGVWYLLWRTVEKKLPAGLTRFLLGANSRPVYVDGTVNSVTDQVYTAEQWAAIEKLRPKYGDVQR
jgi:hypothetical protein